MNEFHIRGAINGNQWGQTRLIWRCLDESMGAGSIKFAFPALMASLSAILLFSLALAGCSALQQTYGIPATDLSWLKTGMSRAEIEARLGAEADSAVMSGTGTAVLYTFNRGYHPPARDNPLWWPVAAAGWETMNLGSLGTRSYWERECQKALLEIRYDPAGLLAGASEELLDLGRLNRGTQDICDRIRSHLLPSTLNIQSIE